MKTSIAITLIITAAIFSFVSGYSIGSHNGQAGGYVMAGQSSGASVATARAAEKAPAGGYGSPAAESNTNSTASPGYGAPSPGYGQ